MIPLTSFNYYHILQYFGDIEMDIDQWKTHFESKLLEKSVLHHNGECLIWTGYSRDGGRGVFYGEIKASYPGLN